MEKEIITAEYNGHTIVSDILPAGSTPQVFCMHGAGTAHKELYDPLRQMLLENNISSCALDFVGHGDTGGDIKDSSLKSRTEQAELIIEKARLAKPLILIGGSMSGYNAIKLTQIYPVNLMVLFAPAVFDRNAYETSFGDDFSSIIRKDRSWDNTDAWGILNGYKGKLLIIAAEEDKVVPFEIVQKIYDNAKQAAKREIVVIPRAPHRLFAVHFKEKPEDLKVVVDKIITFLK